jgi:hypothetical protein
MYIGRKFVLFNVFSLVFNAVVLFLVFVRTLPWFLPLVFVVLWLWGSVWASCKLHGMSLRKRQP